MNKRSLLAALGVAVVAWQSRSFAFGRAEAAVQIPAPAKDTNGSAPMGQLQKAVFAGGCFWGVQGVFQHVKGVRQAVSGYAGGTAAAASYETVSAGNTGHAESVEVTFDPSQVTYGTLLQVFFSVAHDPTQLNRQGPDTGTQYRSAVFPVDDAQQQVARHYIAQLDAAHVYKSPIVTRIEPKASFYPAEGYHQDFLVEHPHHGYIVVNDLPKIADLQRLFPALYRVDPVLVKAKASST